MDGLVHKKFVQPANENFRTFWKKDVYGHLRTMFPTLLSKKLKPFVFIGTVSIRRRLNNGPIYLKTLEKCVQLTNENFETFCKEHSYESLRKSFSTYVLKRSM